MPRKLMMTWNLASRRWFKKLGGRQYAVGMKALESAYPDLFQSPTEEGSYRAANQWWNDQQANKEQQTAIEVTQKLEAMWEAYNARMREARHGGISGKGMLAQLKAGTITPTEVLKQLEEIEPLPNPSSGERVSKCATQFLDVMRGLIGEKISDGRYDNLQRAVNHFLTFVGSVGINEINGAVLTRYHSELIAQIKKKTLSQSYARDTLQVVKQFVSWCYEQDLMANLPRNFRGNSLNISVQVKEVETISVEEIKSLLAKASKKTRLYLLLMLNTGMTQQDISDLTHKEIDFKAGTLTRKRSKTKQWADVPTVTYKLWGETQRLLNELKDTRTERVLLTREGDPLVRRELVNGKLRVNDAVRQAWAKLGASKSPKFVRKTSASLLASHKDFMGVAWLFLGHSPRTQQEKSYTKPPEVILAEGTDWLASQYGEASQ